MTMQQIGLSLAAIALVAPAAAARPPATCAIERATYQAIGKPAFELQFSPIENPKFASEAVSLTFQHNKRGLLATYNLGGSLGYGSYYLRDLAKPIGGQESSNLKPVFFDANWRGTSITKGKAPKYLFIAGFGAEDWYANRAGNRTYPLGEVMWQLSGCRS
jgi:hypothetical protein